MKRIAYGVALTLALLATSCGDTLQKTSELPVIDTNATYPEKEICLQDVAEVSYIPLETTDDFLLDETISIEAVTSKGIVGVCDNKIYLFHPDGKTRTVINKKGDGPDEYAYAHYAEVDWKREEVYVYDFSRKSLMVYTLEGTFKHHYEVDINTRQKVMLDDGKDHLIFYKEKPGKKLKPGKIEPAYRPVVRMNKENGQVDSLLYRQDYFTAMYIKATLGDGNSWNLYLPHFPLLKLDKEVYLNDVSCDTIYRLSDTELHPFALRTPSIKQREEEKYLLQMKGITPHHYFFRLQIKELTNGKGMGLTIKLEDNESKTIMYNRQTGDICIPKFTNKDYQDEDVEYDILIFDVCDANTAYLKLQAHHLTEALEEGKLSGELKTIAEGLKEDDNPVLMVVKFKE